jgi:hypothetical protein
MSIQKSIINTSVLEWSQNKFIQNNFSYSIIKKGFWHPNLKLPLTYNRNMCMILHKIYSKKKYSIVLSSKDTHMALDEELEYLENGLLFTGDKGHYHYLIHGLLNLTAALIDDY